MVDEIKLDKVNVPMTTKKQDVNPKQDSSYKKESDVTITNHLGNLVNTVMAEDNSPSEQMRVLEMKRRIQDGTYSVDTDALADKLYQQLFSKSIGG